MNRKDLSDSELRKLGFSSKDIKLYRILPKYLIKLMKANIRKAIKFGIRFK